MTGSMPVYLAPHLPVPGSQLYRAQAAVTEIKKKGICGLAHYVSLCFEA